MNWKLLLIALSLIFGSSARPAEESTLEETSTLPETTTIVLEKSTTSVPVAATTKKLVKTTEKLSSPAPTTAPATEAPVAPSTVRYLISNMPTKPTNVRQKYANNYANLITKYTWNNNRIVSSVNSSNSNDIVTLHGLVVDSSLPVVTVASSATTSNSSSKPLVFVDADINPTITTKRAFISVNDAGSWSNYNLEPIRVTTTRRRKPVIHKIISKWSDNPNVVYNIHGDGSLITTEASEINQLKDQLVQNSFGPMSVSNLNQLSTFIGQQQVLPHTTTYRPTKRPVTNVKKRPTKNNCKRLKIKLGNAVKNSNGFSSKENCDDINILINNKLHNANTQPSTSGDYTFPNNDKFEDSTADEYDSNEKNDDPQVVTALSQVVPTNESFKFGDKDKDKKKRKKKPGHGGSASQTDDSADGGTGVGVGSMMMTVMTMMAVFNPLNFGVWGIIMAPMAAMLFGGICYGMYNFMHMPMKGWSQHPPAWSKPQEIVIRNRIKHSPIPIKVVHLHKHTRHPTNYIMSEPMDSYGPPVQPYSPPKDYGPPPMNSHAPPPMDSYGPPKGHPMKTHGTPIVMKSPPKTFGEPPAWVQDSYQPSAPSGGPYKRKSNSQLKRPLRPSKNSFKFKLL